MADSYALALQKALVLALKADADVSALVSTRVYDEPPESVTYPYVRIGGIEPSPVRTDGKSASEVTFGIEAHSRPASGRVECTRIAEAVVAALNETSLVVTGFTTVMVHWVTQTVARDSDGQSYSGTIVFRTLLDG